MVAKLYLLVALMTVCSAFTLPQNGFEEGTLSLENGVQVNPSVYIIHDLLNGEQEVMFFPSENEISHRMKRQNDGRPPMPSGSRGQIDIFAENRRRSGTDLNIQATGRLWESRDGRSTLDANANYQRHFGGPSGTGRPNYGGMINFNHRF